LSGFPSATKKHGLGFVSKKESLKLLVIILGGQASISEIQHSSLEELEILRVPGFDNFEKHRRVLIAPLARDQRPNPIKGRSLRSYLQRNSFVENF
jgi:hypothetical protein